jgi:hypothetical protein
MPDGIWAEHRVVNNKSPNKQITKSTTQHQMKKNTHTKTSPCGEDVEQTCITPSKPPFYVMGGG